MEYNEAIEKYPMLIDMAVLDLAVLRQGSIGVDEDFRQAIDAVMKNMEQS